MSRVVESIDAEVDRARDQVGGKEGTAMSARTSLLDSVGSRARVIGVIALTLVIAGPGCHGSRAKWPEGWQGMEIEAKWEIDNKTYDRLVQAFPDRSEKYGYRLKVRWDKISKKFVDVYYDSPEGELGEALHSLRHRTRYTSKPLAQNNALEALRRADWRKDWERVQYKSTPRRMNAVWFRFEAGDDYVWERKGEDLRRTHEGITAAKMIAGEFPKLPAATKLREDHKNLDFSKLVPVSTVVDYRYRVLFLKGNREVYEMSLDRVSTQTPGADPVQSFEAELEMVKPFDEEDLSALMDLATRIQSDFALRPSTTSKGGNEVPEWNAEKH